MHTIKLLILSSLLAPFAALAQSTTVSATVVDTNSVIWANGTYTLQFVPNPQANGNPTWNGNPFPNTQWTYSGVMDASGFFTKSVPSNNFIAPAGSTYTATICPNTSAPCTVIPRLTFQGTSQDMSTTITNATSPMSIQANSITRAYNDSEMAVQASQAGYFYQNVTSNSPRYWNGATWSNFGGTVAAITISSMPPLFTTTAGGSGTNPSFTFAAQPVGGNLVYANCTAGTVNPNFCSITSAMLPSTITSDTSGNAATSTTTTQFASTPTLCSGNNYAKGIGAAGNASCAAVNFTNLAGNISVAQMNSGTSANSTTFWRGDGTWVTPTVPTVPIIKSASAAGCTTGSTSFSFCNSTVTWPSAFADTSYQAVCQGNAPNDPRAYIGGQFTKTTTTMVVQTVTAGSNAVSYSNIDCIAIHP